MIAINLMAGPNRAALQPRKGWHWARPEPAVYAKRRVKGVFRGTPHRPQVPSGLSPREDYLKRTYGITQADFEAMCAAQGGKCAACETPFAGTGKLRTAPVVDHCHDTTRIRGVLCNRCNTTLGLIGDSPKVARGLARYVEQTALWPRGLRS